MDKFDSERVESLKVQLYKIIGRLELEKQIVIGYQNLRTFENVFTKCTSESEAAGCILGAIRRYESMLDPVLPSENVPVGESLAAEIVKTDSGFPEILSPETIVVEMDPSLFLYPYVANSSPEELLGGTAERAVNTTQSSEAHTNFTVIDGIAVIDISNEYAPSTERAGIVSDKEPAVQIVQLTNTFNEDADCAILNGDGVIDDDDDDETVATETDETVATVATETAKLLVITNTLIHNPPYIDEHELNTTRENKSIFLIYSVIDDYNIGCEFTLKKKGKFPRYECKKCRSLCDKDKKSGVATESPAAVTTFENKIKDVKKAEHHTQCRVEFNGTALARSFKNSAVVHKSHYGGSSKQVYDKHTQILSVSSDKLTAFDVAHGFKTFEYASSALKKSNRRKSAINLPKVNVGERDAIDKSTTRIMKSIFNERDDYFLIGQDEKAGVIVLGSKFLIERFFRSKSAMSDGTFKMTPKEYKQTYMMWYIEEGICHNEVLPRSKAMLAVTFLLKGKSEATYKIAFEILDNYRKEHNIAEPEFSEYMTDDEPAVRNVLVVLYPNTIFSLCHFHHNQNIAKCLVELKLALFIRKCKTDEQLWFYGKLKQILVLPLLPPDDIIPAFKTLSKDILSFINSHFTNQFEVDQFKLFFETIEARYFSNVEKIKLTCKYRKHMRCTNLIESTHNVFNKSDIIPQHGTVSNFVGAMKTIDLQYRSTAIAFETKGAYTFPKKKKRYAQQQSVIAECTKDLDDKKISIEEFLKKCSECMIHEKYFKLVEAATERLENSQDSSEDKNEFDEHIMAIFATSESSNGRVRTLCSKYFGDEWLN